jgi:hypothetical protein
MLLTLTSYGQITFQWEKTDSVTKTKDQIYSDTKMFIAETWKSSKDVIQNDDKEAGVILIKGINVQTFSSGIADITKYTFKYNITFRMKDNKYKIIINEVSCIDGICEGYQRKLIQPFEGIENAPSVMGVSKKKSTEMMVSLKQDLQSIVDQYISYIKTPKTIDNF